MNVRISKPYNARLNNPGIMYMQEECINVV